MKEIFDYFPYYISECLKENIIDMNYLEEIRIRNQKPIILKLNNEEKKLDYVITEIDIKKIFELLCENSIYSYQTQIAEGFITIEGGHRVGISGSCVNESNKVINIKYINSLNFRISKQVIGCSDNLIKYIINNKTIYNTLIVSPPGCGKTTLVRDLIRQISNNYGLTVGLVDERSEIASLYKGVSRNDLGIRTDVMDNVSKNIGMKMLIRSMSPQIIVADEIGSKEDINAINYAICSGCKGIFTAHGSNLLDLKNNYVLNELIKMHYLEILILLDTDRKGKAKNIYRLNKESLEYEIINDY